LVCSLFAIQLADYALRRAVIARGLAVRGFAKRQHVLHGSLRRRRVVLALFVDAQSPAEQTAHDVEQFADDADGHQQPSHLMVVVVQTRSRTAVTLLRPQQTAVVD